MKKVEYHKPSKMYIVVHVQGKGQRKQTRGHQFARRKSARKEAAR